MPLPPLVHHPPPPLATERAAATYHLSQPRPPLPLTTTTPTIRHHQQPPATSHHLSQPTRVTGHHTTPTTIPSGPCHRPAPTTPTTIYHHLCPLHTNARGIYLFCKIFIYYNTLSSLSHTNIFLFNLISISKPTTKPWLSRLKPTCTQVV
jgi:hypothetical protein